MKRARKKNSTQHNIEELKKIRAYEEEHGTTDETQKSDDEIFGAAEEAAQDAVDNPDYDAPKTENEPKQKKPGKKLLIFLVALLTLIALFFAWAILKNPMDNGEVENLQPVDVATGKINVLILGVDKGGMRSDTIILASYDLDMKKVNMLSIPRDTRMYVGGGYQKINAAHAIKQSKNKKGVDGTIEAVTRLTSIPINYYVEFTFDAFKDTIDAVGGVDFDVPQNMKYTDPVQDLYINLKKGFQHLDGDKAEQLVRFRQYPNGDIDRVAVQQDFIKAVADQKLNLSIIGKLPDLYEALSENITTNFTLSDVIKYSANLKDLSAENIFMHQLPGQFSGSEYKASYWLPDMDEARELIETEFGYDADKATIHSADGTSKKKDVADSTKAPSSTSKATLKPSSSPKATAKASIKPSESPKPSSKATKKPTKTPDADDDDETPKKTAEATKAPSTSAPRPTANVKSDTDNSSDSE